MAEPEALARELGREAAAQVGVLGPVLHEQLLVRQATGALGFLLQQTLLLKEAVGLRVLVALLAAPRRSAAGAASDTEVVACMGRKAGPPIAALCGGQQ